MASRAWSAPAHYTLDAARSSVTFETDFGPDTITGDMSVSAADLTIDFADLARSNVSVVLDVTDARASFPFAAQALKGPKVLDARHHPTIGFVSAAVRRDGDDALIDGDITIRGVTRRVTLRATIYRQDGAGANDLSRLSVHLTGRVNRSDFGATGWADMVGDEVRVKIIARIERTG